MTSPHTKSEANVGLGIGRDDGLGIGGSDGLGIGRDDGLGIGLDVASDVGWGRLSQQADVQQR